MRERKSRLAANVLRRPRAIPGLTEGVEQDPTMTEKYQERSTADPTPMLTSTSPSPRFFGERVGVRE